MRKRTRKHRGTAGKMVGGFLAFFCLILLTAGMFWAIQGYISYQKAVKEKPLAQAVEEIRSEAQWVPLKQVPELYKKAVLAVEDHRYYTHHGIEEDSDSCTVKLRNALASKEVFNLSTWKTDGAEHGVGTKIIRAIVEKYHGTSKTFWDKERHSLEQTIVFPIEHPTERGKKGDYSSG